MYPLFCCCGMDRFISGGAIWWAAWIAASLALQRPVTRTLRGTSCWTMDFRCAIVLVELRQQTHYNPNAIRPHGQNADFLESAFVPGPKICRTGISTGPGRFYNSRRLSWLGFPTGVRDWKRQRTPACRCWNGCAFVESRRAIWMISYRAVRWSAQKAGTGGQPPRRQEG